MAARTPRSASATARPRVGRLHLAGAVIAGLAVAALTTTESAARAHPDAAAAGGSLVYVKNGAIHVARADGSHDRIVKTGRWYYTSMSDRGVIAAMKTDGRTAPDGSTGYSIFLMRPTGKVIGRVPTPVDASNSACPIYPSEHASLSPDGTKVAFDYFDCNGEFAAWMPATNRLKPHVFGDYYAPQWRSANQLVISHFGTTVTSGQATVALWTTSGRPKGWTPALADSWATSYHATSTRDGRKIALIEDDAANYFDAVPRHVRLVLGTAAGPGRQISKQCSVSLPAKLYAASNWQGTAPAGLSFRPDGNAVTWDAGNGIWTANTRGLSSCSKTSLRAHLWIRGGGYPYFSPAG